VPNIEDSEDPAQDSYASPDVNRQLPFNSPGQEMMDQQHRMMDSEAAAEGAESYGG